MLSGRPGPAVLALPEDVLFEEADVPDAAPVAPARPQPADGDLARLRELLASSERPLVIVGEGGWSAQAGANLLAFCEAGSLPVAASFRCQDYVDNRSPVYAGHLTIGLDPALAARVREADLLVAVGGRLGDIATNGYTLLDVPRPRQALVHVHPDPDELGSVYEPDLALVSGLPELAAAARALDPVEASWQAWTEAARADYLANLEHRPLPGELDLGEVMAMLRRRLPADTVVTSGAGNFTVWAHRFYEFSVYPSQLAPRSGAMAYGVPAALAAKALQPGRTVVCIAGDGDFTMSCQELATAVQYQLPVVIFVVNNRMLGTIRMHQERHFPGRVVGTDLVNPDFAAYAAAFGAHGEVVTRTADFEGALERALGAGRPAVVELVVDPEGISPRATLTEIRQSAR
jgi:acetolactate synthase-1/2/3 large subunit